MLTPTDVHYLVGFLTLVSKPDNVEIELGTPVYDEASAEDRDVDVTVTTTVSTGTVAGYSGIEVKNHKRPLDSTHVEQLSCKMRDMPSLTERAIVSASGYSSPALRKGAKHGIDLLELRLWADASKGFDHFKSTFVPAVQRYLEWIGNVEVHINPNHRVSKEDRPYFLNNPRIYFEVAQPDQPRDLNSVIDKLRADAIKEPIKQWNPANVNPNETKRANVLAVVIDRPYVLAGSGPVFLEEVRFVGQVFWRESQVPTEAYALFRVGEPAPIAGACIFEMSGWGLCGLLLSQSDKNLHFINISISNRNLGKIFRQRLLK